MYVSYTLHITATVAAAAAAAVTARVRLLCCDCFTHDIICIWERWWFGRSKRARLGLTSSLAVWVSDSCDRVGPGSQRVWLRGSCTHYQGPPRSVGLFYISYTLYALEHGTLRTPARITHAHKHIVRICLFLIVRVISFVWSCGWGRTRTLCKELCVVFCLTWRHDVTPGTRRVSDKRQRERDRLTQLTHLLEQSQDIVVRGGTTTVVAARTARWRCV